ncbi:hypothetical protein LIER_19497 [Lithospermum erythrorhizon]|uniref:Retrovirus-related Pol polyprotein from transposon TNT 1-94-like beta-barrel domain-containing protein n=1 Tax=Lithospermum erythrorhizon TaxID=34254 RepID=A0AAV3QKA9_LITER
MNLLGNSDTPSVFDRLIGKPTSCSWIFDTGATVHATGTLGFLVDQFDVVVCPLTLPDGSVIYSTRRGSVVLLASLILRNVLYVPNLSCNLISISQLLVEQCDILFTHNLCFVEDRSARTVIGAGEWRGGLYYFCELPVDSTASPLAI